MIQSWLKQHKHAESLDIHLLMPTEPHKTQRCGMKLEIVRKRSHPSFGASSRCLSVSLSSAMLCLTQTMRPWAN
jgi:hypothetical protein